MNTDDRLESQREVARQLRITNAAFPSMRLTEEAMMAYTEALDMYPADTIAEAFRVARMDSDRNQTHHPRPGEVRKYAALYSKQQRAHQPRDEDAAAPYCPVCLTRTLYDDGTPFGRFEVAHAVGCPAHSPLPPNARFWVQGSTPASFDQQKAEVVQRLSTIPKHSGRPATATAKTPVAEPAPPPETDPEPEQAELLEVGD